jgi:(hydroxyamino)benzene mutase
MSNGSALPSSRLAARNAVALLLIGLLTGGYVSAAMTGKVAADPGMALASHLNALMGAFWLLGLGWSLPLLSYGPVGQTRLVWLTTVPNFANWAVTAFKAMWKVSGVDAIGEVKNDTVFGLLTLLVVLPSLAACAAWLYGFRPAVRQAPP